MGADTRHDGDIFMKQGATLKGSSKPSTGFAISGRRIGTNLDSTLLPTYLWSQEAALTSIDIRETGPCLTVWHIALIGRGPEWQEEDSLAGSNAAKPFMRLSSSMCLVCSHASQ